VSTYTGKGGGTFQPFVGYSITLIPAGVTVGTSTGDKKIDLASAENLVERGIESNVDVLLGNDDGTFGFAIPTSLSQSGVTNSIASGDFNRDGLLDIAIASAAGVDILLGMGNGHFGGEVLYPLASPAERIVAADFNGDGILDLAATNGAQISVFLGKGDGAFQTPSNFLVGDQAWGIAAADMNSDGRIDLVVATNSGFVVLLGNGAGGFNAEATVPVPQFDGGQRPAMLLPISMVAASRASRLPKLLTT
jgi:hypothetical protein